MACGTPAVVSDAVGCAPDLIDESITGAVFPMGDVWALAGAVHAVLGRKAEPAVQRALAEKITIYSVGTAVDGVLAAMDRTRAS